MGRKKEYPERITLTLTTATMEAIDSSLEKGEARLDMIRTAIDRELRRRKRSH